MSKVALTNRLPDFSKLPGESPLSSSSTEVEVNSRLLSASQITHKLFVAVQDNLFSSWCSFSVPVYAVFFHTFEEVYHLFGVY